ncbi:MAG: hypothetical protein ABIF82_06840 [Planctomycetota bacterium]
MKSKESYKWIRGMRQVSKLRDEFSRAAKLVHVFDREGDVHEILDEIIHLGDDGIIRSSCDRKVNSPYGYIRPALAAQPVLTSYKIDVPRKQWQRKRQAIIELRSAELTLTPPATYPGRKPLTIKAVWAHEVDAPEGADSGRQGFSGVRDSPAPLATPAVTARAQPPEPLKVWHYTTSRFYNINRNQYF